MNEQEPVEAVVVEPAVVEVVLGSSGKPISKKYLDAIAYLTEHPDEINGAWYQNAPKPEHPAHCLFQYLTPSGICKENERSPDQVMPSGSKCYYGCLTQIRTSHYKEYAAWTADLTERIRNDSRIPNTFCVELKDLPLFGEYQTEFDELYRNQPVQVEPTVSEEQHGM